MTPAPTVHRLTPATADFVALEEWNGSEAVLYRSPDGRRVAGSFTHEGRLEFTTPCDEFMFVLRGSITITTSDGQRHEGAAGDALYLEKGLSIVAEYSDDFQNVALLVDDTPIDY